MTSNPSELIGVNMTDVNLPGFVEQEFWNNGLQPKMGCETLCRVSQKGLDGNLFLVLETHLE